MSVEPSFLAQVYAGQVDPADKEMVWLLKCGRSTDVQFTFSDDCQFQLVVSCVAHQFAASLTRFFTGCIT